MKQQRSEIVGRRIYGGCYAATNYGVREMKKERWKRIPLSIIRQHDELLQEMLEKRKNNGPCWPYLCGNVIKWKYGIAV